MFWRNEEGVPDMETIRIILYKKRDLGTLV